MTAPDLPVWEQRFRATRVTLPDWALDAPHRCLYVSNPTGTFELFAWDRATGDVRQVTDREHGTFDGALPPDGGSVWWFDDEAGDEHGVWRRQPFAGGPDVGPDEVAVPGVPAAYPAGLAIGHRTVVVGCSDDGGSTVWVREGDDEPRVLYRSEQDAAGSSVAWVGRR